MSAWSIRTRLTIWNGATTMVVMLAFGTAAYALIARTLLARTDGVLEFELRETVEELTDRDMGNEAQEIPAAFLESFLLRVIDAAGRVVVESPKIVGKPIPAGPAIAAEPVYFSDDIGSLGHYRIVVGHVGEGSKQLRVLIGVPLKDYDLELADFRNTMLLVSPIGILAALIGGYYSAGRALRPVHEMTESARHISLHHLGGRLKATNSHDELGRLAATLNLVFDRLQNSFDSMRRFTADASHELMTPLSTIRAEAEVTLQSPRSPEEHSRVLHSIIEEVGRLTRLTGRLLQLARADGKATTMRTDVDLSETLQAAVEKIRPHAARAEVRLTMESAAPAVIVGDREQLRQVFDNLLDNGVKYNRPGGELAVRVRSDDGSTTIEFADRGIGIPPEALDRVFDRFYCVDPSRNRTRGGAGLGLSIAKTLVESMGGSISVESRVDAGSTFRLIFPLKT